MTPTARATGPRPGSNADRVIKYIEAFGATKVCKLCAELDIERTALANSLTLPRDLGLIKCSGFDDEDVVSVPGAVATAPAPVAAPACPPAAARSPEPTAPVRHESARSTNKPAPAAPKAEPLMEASSSPVVFDVSVVSKTEPVDSPAAESPRPGETLKVVQIPVPDVPRQAGFIPPPAPVRELPPPTEPSQSSRFDYAFWGKSGRLFLEKGGARIELDLEETRELCNYLDRQFATQDA